MKGRRLIASQIVSAWQKCIENEYHHQRINSERSLQAAFWAHLNESLDHTRRLFIEPSLQIAAKSDSRRIIPDIVVCNTREIISIIEIKYTPLIEPRYTKDLNNLEAIARRRTPISVSNDRFKGSEKDAKKYALSSNVLFVWAGVHRELESKPTGFFAANHLGIKSSYLQLHAITRAGRSPELVQMRMIRGSAERLPPAAS